MLLLRTVLVGVFSPATDQPGLKPKSFNTARGPSQAGYEVMRHDESGKRSQYQREMCQTEVSWLKYCAVTMNSNNQTTEFLCLVRLLQTQSFFAVPRQLIL